MIPSCILCSQFWGSKDVFDVEEDLTILGQGIIEKSQSFSVSHGDQVTEEASQSKDSILGVFDEADAGMCELIKDRCPPAKDMSDLLWVVLQPSGRVIGRELECHHAGKTIDDGVGWDIEFLFGAYKKDLTIQTMLANNARKLL
jgi:hypothetical protein